MKINIHLFILAVLLLTMAPQVLKPQDTLAIHNLGHASLMFIYHDLVIHVDPRSSEANYDELPDADLVFITHGHGDHFELNALNNVTKGSTVTIMTEEVENLGTYSGTIETMANWDTNEFADINVVAVPAYNFTEPYHPKGVGNGYVFTFGEKIVYVAGDTEDIPEMDSINANIAFLPMNLPFTMTQDQAVSATLMVDPEILYIYHFSSSDTALLRTKMQDHDSIEVRIGESLYLYNTTTGESVKVTEEPDEPTRIDAEQIGEIKIYPNPVGEKIHLSQFISHSEIEIRNLHGIIVEHKTITGTSVDIDMKKYPDGVYFLIFIDKNGNQQSLKFIKIN